MSQHDYTCDGCDANATGYGKKELTTEGWAFHGVSRNRTFVLCGECMERYAPLWAENEKAAA